MSSHIRLGADNVLGAGAVLTKSVDDSNKILAGVPAKILKERSDNQKLNGVPRK